MKVYRVVTLIDDHFVNYLGDCVYLNEQDAIEEVKRIHNLCVRTLGTANVKVINNNWTNVQIVDKNDEMKIYKWFGYETLTVIWWLSLLSPEGLNGMFSSSFLFS